MFRKELLRKYFCFPSSFIVFLCIQWSHQSIEAHKMKKFKKQTNTACYIYSTYTQYLARLENLVEYWNDVCLWTQASTQATIVQYLVVTKTNFKTNYVQIWILKNNLQQSEGLSGFDNWHTLHTYSYFYWRTHDSGHAYVDTYTHFFSMIVQIFQNLSGSYNFILFQNLLL